MPFIVRKEGDVFFVTLIATDPDLDVDAPEVEVRKGEGEGELSYEHLLRRICQTHRSAPTASRRYRGREVLSNSDKRKSVRSKCRSGASYSLGKGT
jgi:hypothetical protein